MHCAGTDQDLVDFLVQSTKQILAGLQGWMGLQPVLHRSAHCALHNISQCCVTLWQVWPPIQHPLRTHDVAHGAIVQHSS